MNFHLPAEATKSDAVPLAPTPAASVPKRAVRMAFFGPPPLLEGEDSAAYGDLLARVSAAVQPADIFEEIWLRDFLDLAWEALRYRRLKAALVNNAVSHGLDSVLRPLLAVQRAGSEEDGSGSGEELPTSFELAVRWAARDREVVAQVDELLAAAGLTMDAALAGALTYKLDHVERIDRMIMSAEARRNAVLHEIERHRATLGQELRRVVREAEDAEFEMIESTPAVAAGAM